MKSTVKLLVIGVAMTWMAPPVAGQDSGGDFVTLTESFRDAYVWGVYAGFYFLYKRPETDGERAVRECIYGWDSRQMGEVVYRYANQHPERWHLPASTFVVWALETACGVRDAPPPL